MRRWHDFGNQLVQLCDALALAKAHAVEARAPGVPAGRWSGSAVAGMGLDLFVDPRPNAPRGSWNASPEQVTAVADDSPRLLEPVAPA